MSAEHGATVVLRGQGMKPDSFTGERTPFTQFQTWLSETKGMVGCPLGCEYCFLQLDGKTPMRPSANMNQNELLSKLAASNTYHPDMPINVASETDVFSTQANRLFYKDFLEIYGKSEYPNPIIIITKSKIPNDFMKLASSIKQKVIFYISYSGLSGTDIEPNIRTNNLKENFIRLKQYGLPAVHYWRPFLPQNSNEKIIEEILEHVTKYAECSVVNGLRLNEGILHNLTEYWPELCDEKYDFSKNGEFWPKGVRQNLISYVRENYPSYPVFFGNTPCSLTYALDINGNRGLFNGRMCLESNCPQKRREKCSDVYKIPKWKELGEVLGTVGLNISDVVLKDDRLVISKKLESGKIAYLRLILNFPVVAEDIDDRELNWANIQDSSDCIEIPWSK